MPRIPRIISESGYMHLMFKGVNGQIIFEERNDYIYFLNLLKRAGIEQNVKICAYCLMENHVHLLIYDRDKNTPEFMKRLCQTYALFFNKKYQRTGHLYQNRYTSKPIESESYLLKVFHYILNNPREAGICSAADYPWSSYGKYGLPNSFVDTLVLRELIGGQKEYEAFIAADYSDGEESDEIISRKKDDEWAKEIIQKYLHVKSGTVLQTFSLEARNEALRLLKEKGLSIRQIERLTGINRNAIHRA